MGHPVAPPAIRADDNRAGGKKRSMYADERKRVKVLALEGHVLDLQRQLQQLELQRTHEMAQLETLRKYVHEPASAPAQPGANGSDPAGALVAPEERTRGWRPSTPTVVAGGQCRLCDEAAAQVASVMTSLRGPGAPFTTVAECKALSAADMADFHEELVNRVRVLLQQGAEVDGSPPAQELEWLILQRRNIWCMGSHAAVWRNSADLYYGLISEIIRRAVDLWGPPDRTDFDVKLAAMALTDEQRTTIVAEAEEMREQLVEMFSKQRQLFAKLGTLPPAGPMAPPDNSVMLEIQDLVCRLGDVIGAFSARVWTHTTALQHARGLVATPYILCGVTVGAHLMAPSDGLIAACHAGSMMEVIEWLRSDDAELSGASGADWGMPAYDVPDSMLVKDDVLDLISLGSSHTSGPQTSR